MQSSKPSTCAPTAAQNLVTWPPSSGWQFRALDGATGDRLLAALAEDDVVAGVLGAHCSPDEGRPADGTTFRVLEHTTKPVVIVPPGCTTALSPEQPTPRRLLIPLEGQRVSSQPVVDALDHLLAAQVEVIVLHVFTADTMPRMLDRPVRDLSMWGDEFVARFCSPASRIELRIGAVADHVAGLAEAEHIDLGVMSWSRNRTAGHAKVVCEVLATSQIPILLLAVAPEAPVPDVDW